MLSVLAFSFLCFLAYGYANQISSDYCPESDLILPCTCENGRAECKGMTSAEDLLRVFGNVPGWNLRSFTLINSSMLFFPASIFNDSNIRDLVFQDSTLVSLFDQPPPIHLDLLNLKNIILQRGIQWDLLSRMTLDQLHVENTRIRSLGNEFRDGIPKGLYILELINTDISKIRTDALEKLEEINQIIIRKGALRNIDHLSFPQNVYLVDLSDHQIQSLSNGFFNFQFEGRERSYSLDNNLIPTLKKEVFGEMNEHTYVHVKGNPIKCDCKIKWLLTSKIQPSKIIGTCAAPKRVEGKYMYQLNASDFDYC